jgi:hypothetical protein
VIARMAWVEKDMAVSRLWRTVKYEDVYLNG